MYMSFPLFRPPPHQMMDGSPYKMRSLPVAVGASGSGSGLNLVPSSHLLQTDPTGISTEPVTPPSPQVSHSNLSQVARAHPYAAALPAPLPTNSSSMGRFSGQSTMPSASIYANSATVARSEPPTFPLRSPPDRSGEFRRRLTLLPHSGLSPMDYGGGPPGLSGPGPGGGRHQTIQNVHPPMTYSSAGVDVYREPLMIPMASGESAHKKLRIGEPLLMKATMAQPLRIDTRPVVAVATSAVTSAPVVREVREQPAYIPQVEAISPTLPCDNEDPVRREDSPLRSTKDDLLQQITKVYMEEGRRTRHLACYFLK